MSVVEPGGGGVVSGRAWFSACGTYRYALLRLIDHGLIETPHREHCVNFVMLNPSTADATLDDPTIRRCIGYARAWGYGEMMVTNLFAHRATDPRELRQVSDPVGPENDAFIGNIAGAADLVVAAWGNHGALHGRDSHVRQIVRLGGKKMHCLRVSALGQPWHPLYLPKDLVPVLYERPAAAPATGAAFVERGA